MFYAPKKFSLQRRQGLLASLAGLAWLGGCGGGVDSGGTGTGGAPPTYALGPIAGFGSVFVNGVRYDDSAATLTDEDGLALLPADLGLGMQAAVQASGIAMVAGVSSATATSITIKSSVVGPVQALDRIGNTLVALGQRVAITATTVFGAGLASGVAGLAVGDVIEVHGTLDLAQQRWVASRVQRRTAAPAYKLRGAVASLDLAARTLTMGSAVVDWSGVAIANPASALAVGTLLRVTVATAALAGVWRASAVVAQPVALPDRERVEIEGRITAFASPARFEVNGIAVDASTASFPAGSAGLKLGVKVEVKGSARNGLLVAQTVSTEDDDRDEGVELHGSIESANAATRSFVIRGVAVQWDASTRFDSSSAADIVNGRRAEVRGVLQANGTRVLATLIHVER